MGIYLDPVTRQRIPFMKETVDLEFNRTGGSAISQQVSPIISPTRGQQMHQGLSNALFGTDAALEGARVPQFGVTGENKQTTRRDIIRRRVKV